MNRGTAALLALSLTTLTGCATTAPAARPQPRAAADLDAWLSAEAPSAPPAARTLSPLAAGPVHIAAPEPAPPRPRLGSHVDIRFQRADIKNAFQFLADAGQFNLVLDDTLSGQVSARLLGVDPYDALVSLAEANGASVRYERRMVVVRRR